MNIYRVVISFFRENLQFMSERGALAMTPGEALDQVMGNLQIDQTRIRSLKTMVSKPETLEEFSGDAQMMSVVGNRLSVKDLWESRPH